MTYTVTAKRLNGRRKPDVTADVGKVRNQGDTITGDQVGDWVEADDDLYYKAEFLAEDLKGEPVDEEDDDELPAEIEPAHAADTTD